MFEEISSALRRNGALVDTNLFVLLLVGRYDPSKLDKFRATQKYNIRTFKLLEALLTRFSRIFTTPNVATEVDNLFRQTSKAEWSAISSELRRALTGVEEEAFSSLSLASNRQHELIGIADCSVFEMSGRGILIVTDDLALTSTLEKHRRAVINLSRYLLDDRMQ